MRHRIFYLLEPPNPLIDERLYLIDLHSQVHVLHLLPAPSQNPPHGADFTQHIQERRRPLPSCAAEKANDADHAIDLDGLQGLRERVRASDLDDLAHPVLRGRERAC